MSDNIEQRIARLEQEVRKIRNQVDAIVRAKPWWEQIAGTFEKDPVYAKAMKLGRKYRRSLAPPSER